MCCFTQGKKNNNNKSLQSTANELQIVKQLKYINIYSKIEIERKKLKKKKNGKHIS